MTPQLKLYKKVLYLSSFCLDFMCFLSFPRFKIESKIKFRESSSFFSYFQPSSLLEISEVDLCLSPALAGAKKNLSSDTYVKDDSDIANMEDLEVKVPIIVETLVNDSGKLVSSIASSNHWQRQSPLKSFDSPEVREADPLQLSASSFIR